jgi:HTH-type transcriptional regulator / antitoxin HigA
MKFKIDSKKAYHETMVAIFNLMNKGEANLSKSELNKLGVMAKAAEKYEIDVLGLDLKPATIAEIVEKKMYEQKLTQTAFAAQLGMGKSKLSEILSGKRKPDVPFLKALYKKFNVDPGFLLDHA